MDLLPHEEMVYLGDTARCPYGPRPVEEVRRFALEIMDHLLEQDVKMVVIACNSAASAALDVARERYDLPVLSVIEPGVRAAVAATRNRRVGLIGTVATVSYTLILGCTHYPLLSGVIQYVMGEEVVLVSSAEATANEVFAELKDKDLLNRSSTPGKHRFIASSEGGMFSQLGELLLGHAFTEVEHRPWAEETT
jgi:glutamate racemase